MKWVLACAGRPRPQSPSVWRVWIEIDRLTRGDNVPKSPSVWRVWIEIQKVEKLLKKCPVTLRVEGVD